MTDAAQSAFEALAARSHGTVERDAPLAPLTSYQLGGPASVLLHAESEDDLAALAQVASESGLPVLVVGRGSNMLVSDRGFRGIAVHLGGGFRWIQGEGDRMAAGAAVPVPGAAGAALDRRLSGLEFAVAIPASVGGAVRMNAGAHGHEIREVLASAGVFLLAEARSVTLAGDEIGFEYRRTGLPRDAIVTSAVFELRPGSRDEIAARMREARDWRRATQPLNLPNAGSVFKNPPGDAAGRLIESICGRDLRVGRARVSDVHANFIVAERGARADEVYSLMRRIQRMVAENAGVELEPEMKLVGEFADVGDGPRAG
jgi:UDP-N-acetylmuramate dehydrogenase